MVGNRTTFCAAVACMVAATAGPAGGQVINEILASHTGTDDTEFVELFGPPGGSLAGLSLIAVEGSSTPGTIDERIDFGPGDAFGANGFFLIGNAAGLAANYRVAPDLAIDPSFENDSTTYALVQTSSIGGSSATGSEIVLDSVALTDGDPGDRFFFGAPALGPDGTFFPAGARRVQDGVDTDAAEDFVFAAFNLGSANTPTPGHAAPPEPVTVTIMAIQGSGPFSPLFDTALGSGELVQTSGIVTAINAAGSVLWIQDPVGDGDPRTSDGILVAGARTFSSQVNVGDLITVRGRVEEQQFGQALPLTRIVGSSLAGVTSRGNELPSPVRLHDLPNRSVRQGIGFFEPLEGMLVQVRRGRVVAPTNRFGEFALVTRRDAVPGSGFRRPTSQMFLRASGPNQVDYNPERILIDDSTLDAPIIVRPGDRVRRLIGVLDYTFANYKIQPVDFDIALRTPERPFRRQGGPGNARITTFNLENLFDTVDDPDKDDESSTPTPARLETKLTKLALAIEDELKLPDILVVQEIENTAILRSLGDRVNAAAGTSYTAVSFESSDRRGIEVGFLYDTDRVELVGAFRLGTGPSAGLAEQVAAAFGGRSASPGREPLVGRFDLGGLEVWVVGNHFKSKGGDNPIFGLESLDGEPFTRATEAQRKLQARVVRDFVNELFEGFGDDLAVIVAGDLNDFQFGEPGEGLDHPVAIIEGSGGEVPLANLVDLERASERFTFIFDGNSQVLDHILVSPSMLDRLVGTDIIHFNASFPDAVAEDATTPIRSSDHDPVELRVRLPRPDLAAR